MRRMIRQEMRWMMPILWVMLLGCSSEASPGEGAGEAPAASARAAETSVGSERLGDGFVVWESNRTGAWRIWTRRLDGTGLRQLSPDEPGMQHCCPHVAPDGSGIAYLARRIPDDRYPETEVAGPLRLVTPDGESERTLVAAARTYGWGDRAVVWRSPEELIYVGPEGKTHRLDVTSGTSTPLTTEPRAELGWLINATLTHATAAAPVFAPYDRRAKRVISRPELGGCEPYFSHDGRWGVFMPAGGGPIRRIDLTTREVETLVPKNDPRLDGRGYLYFPMPSRDGRLLAFGASPGQHSHFTSDYDVFVAPTDPSTLELIGDPVRLTEHPGTDRYPDVYLEPLPLGRYQGEAPLTVRFSPKAPEGTADWSYGDGTTETAAAGRHVYETPGTYEVSAEWRDEVFRGRVVVEPSRPPEPVQAVLRGGGRRIEVRFNEEVAADKAKATLASGLPVQSLSVDDTGRTVLVELGTILREADTLRLQGVTDRSGEPRAMQPASLDIEPPRWPVNRAGLAFLWETADAPNLVHDPKLEVDRAWSLESRGRARLDRHQRMVLGEGYFVAPGEAAGQVLEAVRSSFELTLVATVTPAQRATDGFRPIVNFASSPERRNLTLAQQGGKLVARVRTGSTGPNADRPQVPLFDVTAEEPVHVVLTYQPGELKVYRDGELVVETGDVHGGLNPWRGGSLLFGSEIGGGGDWSGILEGVAIYGRVWTPAEAREDFLRYRAVRRERQTEDGEEGDVLRVRARLRSTSEPPTLREISPYREALFVHEWEVLEVVEGNYDGDRLRVAHWAILDGEDQPSTDWSPGREATLELTPYAGNPQLESVFLKDTLDPAWELTLYVDK